MVWELWLFVVFWVCFDMVQGSFGMVTEGVFS